MEVVSIPLAGKSNIADHMVIASGRSSRQVASMAVKLGDKIKERFGRHVRIEGLPVADWVLIDADDVIVHIFRPEVRNFYNLERMWAFGDDSGVNRGCTRVRHMRFVALLVSLLAFMAQPAAAASSPTMSGLEQQLSYFAAGKSADIGIAALDLNTGETVSIKGNTPFPMASTVKVAVAALYMAQVDHGRRNFDDTINGVPVRR